MTLQEQAAELHRVADVLPTLAVTIPAEAHISVSVADDDDSSEVDVHGCSPNALSQIILRFPRAEIGEDAYGNPKWVQVNYDGLLVSFYVK